MFDPQYGCTQDALIARYNLPIYTEWAFAYNGEIYSSEAPTWEMALAHIAEAYQIPLSALNPDDWELLNSGPEELKPRKTEVNTWPLIP